MPMNSVIVKVVQDCQAVFGSTALLQFTVVGLRLSNASILGPVALTTIRGGCKLLKFSGPEPAVDGSWLQVGPIATFEIADTAAGPDVLLLVSRKREKKLHELNAGKRAQLWENALAQ